MESGYRGQIPPPPVYQTVLCRPYLWDQALLWIEPLQAPTYRAWKYLNRCITTLESIHCVPVRLRQFQVHHLSGRYPRKGPQAGLTRYPRIICVGRGLEVVKPISLVVPLIWDSVIHRVIHRKLIMLLQWLPSRGATLYQIDSHRRVSCDVRSLSEAVRFLTIAGTEMYAVPQNRNSIPLGESRARESRFIEGTWTYSILFRQLRSSTPTR